MEQFHKIEEPAAVYRTLGDNEVLNLIGSIRNGMGFDFFSKIAAQISLTLSEWSRYLHISERSMQRYKKNNQKFDAVQAERIVEIAMLYNYGSDVFGVRASFEIWLDSESIALGRIKPKDLLDSTLGINLLRDELGRIEHGVLA